MPLNWAANRTWTELRKYGVNQDKKRTNMRKGRKTNKENHMTLEQRKLGKDYFDKTSLRKTEWWYKKRWAHPWLTVKLDQGKLMITMEGSGQDTKFMPQKMLWIFGNWILGVICKLSLTGGIPSTMPPCSPWGIHLEVSSSFWEFSHSMSAFSIRCLTECGVRRPLQCWTTWRWSCL